MHRCKKNCAVYSFHDSGHNLTVHTHSNFETKKMKAIQKWALLIVCILLSQCQGTDSATKENAAANRAPATGQSGVIDSTSSPNIVQTAIKSEQHTTLVKAVQAAGLVDALSNAGPFTVFAPTNEAFDKLPAGTVEGLLKADKKDDLTNILGYHTYVGVLEGILLQDGYAYDMVFGGKIQITKSGDKTLVNGNEIIASIKSSNGVIHVINAVLMPPATK